MPLAQINAHTCHYRLDGPDEAPVLMLSHSLGLDYGMWDPQVSSLERHFRVLRYDLRGHGASSATPGDYSVEQLGQDAIALADALGIATFAFCGVSLGGMVAQWLAAHAPDRVTRVVVANSSPNPDSAALDARRRLALEGGMAAVEPVAMGRYFSPAFLEANSSAVTWARRTLRGTDVAGYAGCCAAVRDVDLRDTLQTIRMPVLVIAGMHDTSMPWESHGRMLAESIPGCQVVQLETAHLSNLERPRAFAAALHRFLLPPAENTLDAGFAMRRSMLGAAHVDRARASTTPFTAAFQDLITRFAWGTIWTRPGLDPRTRRLLVIAMMAALGRWEEFRLHVRTGLAHELEPDDLEEILLQVAVYAGIPAANTAFHHALEELEAAGRS